MSGGPTRVARAVAAGHRRSERCLVAPARRDWLPSCDVLGLSATTVDRASAAACLQAATMGRIYGTRGDGRVKVGEPIWQDLERPRVPSGEELRLVEQLAASVDEPLLDRQAATASVVAVCRCGCSSLRLHSDEPPLPEERVVQLSDNDRPDYFYVDARGDAPDLPSVQVVLHVVQGRIHELEIFAGEGVAVPLASLTDLTDITVA